MKNIKYYLFLALALLLAAAALILASANKPHEPPEPPPTPLPLPTPDPFRDVETDDSLVYWSPWGQVYHFSLDCPTIQNSDLESGTIEESGKARACRICERYGM
jgi:hypothetical protein